jgi:hypothetical protein
VLCRALWETLSTLDENAYASDASSLYETWARHAEVDSVPQATRINLQRRMSMVAGAIRPLADDDRGLLRSLRGDIDVLASQGELTANLCTNVATVLGWDALQNKKWSLALSSVEEVSTRVLDVYCRQRSVGRCIESAFSVLHIERANLMEIITTTAAAQVGQNKKPTAQIRQAIDDLPGITFNGQLRPCNRGGVMSTTYVPLTAFLPEATAQRIVAPRELPGGAVQSLRRLAVAICDRL